MHSLELGKGHTWGEFSVRVERQKLVQCVLLGKGLLASHCHAVGVVLEDRDDIWLLPVYLEASEGRREN